jgi:hypothetical protein
MKGDWPYFFGGTPDPPLGGVVGRVVSVGRTPSLMKVPAFPTFGRGATRVVMANLDEFEQLLNICLNFDKAIVGRLQNDPLGYRSRSLDFTCLLIDLPKLFDKKMSGRRIESRVRFVAEEPANSLTIGQMDNNPASLPTREEIIPSRSVSVKDPAAFCSEFKGFIQSKGPDYGTDRKNCCSENRLNNPVLCFENRYMAQYITPKFSDP